MSSRHTARTASLSLWLSIACALGLALAAGPAWSSVFRLVQTAGPTDHDGLEPYDVLTFDIRYEQRTELVSLGFGVRTTGSVRITGATQSLSQWLDYGTYAFFSPIMAGFGCWVSYNPGPETACDDGSATLALGWAWTAGAPPAYINPGLIDREEPFTMGGSAGVLGTVTVQIGETDGAVEILETRDTYGRDGVRIVNELDEVDLVLASSVLDADGDGVDDRTDNCPLVPNGIQQGTCLSADPAFAGLPCLWEAECGDLGECSLGQEDADGDGRGDVCECGDANGDGRLDTSDARLIQRCAVGSVACSPLCDATGDGVCNTLDSRVVQRHAVGGLPKILLICAASPDPSASSPHP